MSATQQDDPSPVVELEQLLTQIKRDAESHFGPSMTTVARIAELQAALISSLQAELKEANRIADGWNETARFHCKNEFFYRDLVRRIGEPFGEIARTSDDGSIQQDVLALKVPELVDGLRAQLAEARKGWRDIKTAPKNGEWILLGWFEFPGQKSMEVAFWNRIKDKWCGAYVVFNNKGYPTPTHWQPLPDPPK